MREQQPSPAVPEVPVSSEASDPRLSAALQTLEQGIDRIMTSEGFAQYLKTMSKFHQYSFNNTLLIMMQRPDASRVAGYRKWQELNRQVRKGEKAIKIFVPHTFRDKDDLDERGKPKEKLAGYGIGNVFALEQTDGDPLPEPPEAKLLEGMTEQTPVLYDGLSDLLKGRGATVKRVHIDPEGPNGYYKPSTKEIAVSYRLFGDAALKTLAHEGAHFIADHRGHVARDDAETVAESSAFVFMNRFGIDSGQYTFAYVSSWAGDRKVLQRNLAEIQKVSHAMIAGVETYLEKPREEIVLFDRPPSRDELRPNRGLGGTPPHK